MPELQSLTFNKHPLVVQGSKVDGINSPKTMFSRQISSEMINKTTRRLNSSSKGSKGSQQSTTPRIYNTQEINLGPKIFFDSRSTHRRNTNAVESVAIAELEDSN